MGTSLQCLRKMFKCAIVLLAVSSQDSAVIQSHRLGGNFAYSAHEAHAYGVQTPIIEQRVVPTGVTFHHGVPQVRTHTSVHKQLIPQYGVVKTQHTVPIVQHAPIFGTHGVQTYVSGFPAHLSLGQVVVEPAKEAAVEEV